jgi:hypothetical protein
MVGRQSPLRKEATTTIRSTRVFLAGVVACGFLLAAAPTSAATKKITGKLSQPGFTVLALDGDGEAASKPAQANGKFKLRPPAKRVSLHLRAADGTYAGPIVIDKKGPNGKKAILGVDAGAELGKVKVRDDFAKLKDELERSDQDRKRKAKAKRGVPIGAGNFGRVAAPATGVAGPGQDLDRDGIPGALDIDDDGDLVLDNNDAVTGPSPARARAARGQQAPPEIFDIHTQLTPPGFTPNANTPGSTDAQIESALPIGGRLQMEIIPGDSSELDCAGDPSTYPPRPGLPYCSLGGTGRAWEGGVDLANQDPFPECCDPDGDGFGSLQPVPGRPAPANVISHGATSSQIASGDLLIQRVTTGGEETLFPATLQFVLATSPAVVSFSDTAGNSTTVSYPGPGPGDPGTEGNGFPVAAGPDGDVTLTLTFWRPQRRPIPPETGSWIDIGGLTYTTQVQHVGGPATGTVQKPCPQSAFSTSDPQLVPPSPAVPAPGFTDLADDQPASPANTITYTLNLTDCFTALGATLDPGEETGIDFMARVSRPDAPDNAVQNLVFARE